MKYLLFGGVLYGPDGREKFARVRRSAPCQGLAGPGRVIELTGESELSTGIRQLKNYMTGPGDARNRQYVVLRGDREEAVATPSYATQEGQTPAFPLNRAPKVDRASVSTSLGTYSLRSRGPTACTVSDGAGRTVMTLTHRGITGGWDIDSSLPPDLTCAMFIFSRYMESENEFIAV